MNIGPLQKIELREEYGIYATNACDRCGKILGPVRFTIKGKPGEWCSRSCRSGAQHEITYGDCLGCGVSLVGGRKGRLYCSDVCRKRLGRRNNPETPIQNKGLTTTFLSSLDYPTIPPFFEQQPGQAAAR